MRTCRTPPEPAGDVSGGFERNWDAAVKSTPDKVWAADQGLYSIFGGHSSGWISNPVSRLADLEYIYLKFNKRQSTVNLLLSGPQSQYSSDDQF